MCRRPAAPGSSSRAALWQFGVTPELEFCCLSLSSWVAGTSHLTSLSLSAHICNLGVMVSPLKSARVHLVSRAQRLSAVCRVWMDGPMNKSPRPPLTTPLPPPQACQAAIDQIEKRNETFKAAVQGPEGAARGQEVRKAAPRAACHPGPPTPASPCQRLPPANSARKAAVWRGAGRGWVPVWVERPKKCKPWGRRRPAGWVRGGEE